jgi:hypothetical protein
MPEFQPLPLEIRHQTVHQSRARPDREDTGIRSPRRAHREVRGTALTVT